MYLNFKLKYLLLLITSDEPSDKNRGINPYHNGIFITIGGASGIGSLSYERKIVAYKALSLWAHAGIGTFKIRDFRDRFNPDLLIPIGLNTRIGQKKHSGIAGMGMVLNYFVMADGAQAVRNTSFGYFAKLGYRFTFNQNRTYLQLAYTPILNRNNYIHNWAGLSIAYAF